MAANAVDVVVVFAGEVAAARPLDLDDVGAHVGEVAAAQGRRDGVLQRDDTHAFQRSHRDGSFIRDGAGKRGGRGKLKRRRRRRRVQRMPARMKLCTNWRWNNRNATSNGALVIRVAAVTIDQSMP